jgi:hypothetical protein
MNKDDLDAVLDAIEAGLNDAREELSQAAWEAINKRLAALVAEGSDEGEQK